MGHKTWINNLISISDDEKYKKEINKIRKSFKSTPEANVDNIKVECDEVHLCKSVRRSFILT